MASSTQHDLASAAAAGNLNETVVRKRSLSGNAGDRLVRLAAGAGRLLPIGNPTRHGVSVTRNLSYTGTDHKAHRLDLYRPEVATGPLPVILYIHGGAFQILSKDTHWTMGMAFAARGFMVVSINYRLAPKHKFPAASQDVASAYSWVVRNIGHHGGDPNQIVVAGESAGANLAASVAVMASFDRPEPWAKAVLGTGVSPIACIPACGILQVSDTDRYRRRGTIAKWVTTQIEACERVYLDGAELGQGGSDLADPLLVIESGAQPHRPLPPFFVPIGTRDPLLDDSRRLERALQERHVRVEAKYYKGGIHAFHAVPTMKTASRCWQDKFDFLDSVLAERVGPAKIPHARRPAVPGAMDDWYV